MPARSRVNGHMGRYEERELTWPIHFELLCRANGKRYTPRKNELRKRRQEAVAGGERKSQFD